jgi:hypothetical protein
VRFLSSYGCWFGNGELAYGCLSKERQNQIELKDRADKMAKSEMGEFSNEKVVASYYGALLVEQAGKNRKWENIDRQIVRDNDFDYEDKQAARETAWNEMQPTAFDDSPTSPLKCGKPDANGVLPCVPLKP